MPTAKKLYYDIDLVATAGIASVFKVVQGTGPNFGSATGAAGITGVTPDKYGNVMTRNAFDGVAATNQGRRTQQAIRAWAVCENLSWTVDANPRAGIPAIVVDFVAPTSGNPLLAPPLEDPTLVARPWVRVFTPTIPPASGLTGRIRVYVDRQHSLEV